MYKGIEIPYEPITLLHMFGEKGNVYGTHLNIIKILKPNQYFTINQHNNLFLSGLWKKKKQIYLVKDCLL